MTSAEIVAILLAGAGLLKKPVEAVVSAAAKDAYEQVKGYLKRKFVSSPDAQKALEHAEDKPESAARKAVLLEEVEPLSLGEDRELVTLVKRLREAIGASATLTQQNVNVNQSGQNNSVTVVGGDLIQPLKHVTKTEVKPDEQHVTSDQKKKIKDLIDEVAVRLAGDDGNPNYRAAWGRLYDEFNVTTYHLLLAKDFDAAIQFLREQKAMSRSRLRRRDPQGYRNDFYATIHSSKDALGWTDEQVYAFAEEKLEKRPIRSLRKLGPNQLKKLAECIARKSKQVQGASDGIGEPTHVR